MKDTIKSSSNDVKAGDCKSVDLVSTTSCSTNEEIDYPIKSDHAESVSACTS